MATYDPLINYLYKNLEVDQNTAISLLYDESGQHRFGYTHKPTAYTTLNDLVKRNILTRSEKKRDGVFYYWLTIKARPVKPPGEVHPTTVGHDLYEHWAVFYRYLIRYGAQHFSSPARVDLMAVFKVWIHQYRDVIQFAALLEDLIDNPLSKHEYKEHERGLVEAGWYKSDYDALSQLDEIIKLLNPHGEKDFLGISDESWEALHRHDNLRRINVSEEDR